MKITHNYDKEQYIADISRYSMNVVWDAILTYIQTSGTTEFLDIYALGELYELGLSIQNKEKKKQDGVYYTPKDVADLMANYYNDFVTTDICVCDVCAGTGNLMIAVLNRMDQEKRNTLLRNRRVYLYDIDELALKIALHSIGYLFGYEYVEYINICVCDFLDREVHLPENSVVISNPPYFKIQTIKETWEKTPLLLNCREYYASFMEKCIRHSLGCVFITPISFLGGVKFINLRKRLNDTKTFVIAFDNVPGNIFKGKKYGIFNSNMANATRAAITVVETTQSRGAVVTPLIRFLTAERTEVLKRKVLDRLLNKHYYQKISDKHPTYAKVDPQYRKMFSQWIQHTERFQDLLSDTETEYRLDMPTTCRYFTTASKKVLRRDGKYTLFFKDEDTRNYAYVLLNSSLAYWYWRIYDGAITYSKELLKSMPINYSELTAETKQQIASLCEKYFQDEQYHLVYKENAGKTQENIKIDDAQREQLNQVVCDIFHFGKVDFTPVHSNSFFVENRHS